jgi:hypothetical protein
MLNKWGSIMFADVVVPTGGALTARIFENTANGVAKSLVYDIAIPVRFVLGLPADQDNDAHRRTDVRLEFIRVGLASWRDLPGRRFDFPVNPAAGYVDGSVYFDGAHQYADLTRLRFGTLVGSKLATDLSITFNMYPNSALPDLPANFTVDWHLPLDVDAVELDRVIAEARRVLQSP